MGTEVIYNNLLHLPLLHLRVSSLLPQGGAAPVTTRAMSPSLPWTLRPLYSGLSPSPSVLSLDHLSHSRLPHQGHCPLSLYLQLRSFMNPRPLKPVAS